MWKNENDPLGMGNHKKSGAETDRQFFHHIWRPCSVGGNRCIRKKDWVQKKVHHEHHEVVLAVWKNGNDFVVRQFEPNETRNAGCLRGCIEKAIENVHRSRSSRWKSLRASGFERIRHCNLVRTRRLCCSLRRNQDTREKVYPGCHENNCRIKFEK